jgi:hypothetical protein
MKDEEFLALPTLEARRHANFQGDPDEARLKGLYLARTGVDLDAGVASSTPGDNVGVVTDGGGGGLGGLGWSLIALGVMVAIGAFFFEVGVGSGSGGLYGVPERVANIDRIAIRHMLLATGLASIVSGWVLVAANHVAKAVRSARG